MTIFWGVAGGVFVVVLLLVLWRARLVALWMGLPPPQNKVKKTTGLVCTMSDGVELVADLYSPRKAGSFPCVLIRTPYDRRQSLFARRFAERGFHVLLQDVRGRFDSGGTYEALLHEAQDGRETLEWIATQPWCNGAVGMWGVSYLGYVQWAVAATAPPCLKAIVPALVGPELFSTTHQDGAFNLDLRLRALQGVLIKVRWGQSSAGERLRLLLSLVSGRLRRSLEAAFLHLPLLEVDEIALGQEEPDLRKMLTHTRPDDDYWGPRDHSASLPQITAPVLLVGGWFDIYLRAVLSSYETLRASGRNPSLIVGPWSHSQLPPFLASLRQGLTWFETHLCPKRDEEENSKAGAEEGSAAGAEKGSEAGEKSEQGKERAVQIFVMGANEWRDMEEWPPASTPLRYYLHPQGQLSQQRPLAQAEADHYTYDPSNPTPSLGGATLDARKAGQQDLRSLERRPDLLCYTSEPLEEDLEFLGPVRLELFVHSDHEQTDFGGRLCDVQPQGASLYVCDGLFRLEPGKGEEGPQGSIHLVVDLWATAYRFQRGHRLRLHVFSGAHPRWTRNPGSGDPLATATTLERQQQTVFHDQDHPSALVLPLVR